MKLHVSQSDRIIGFLDRCQALILAYACQKTGRATTGTAAEGVCLSAIHRAGKPQPPQDQVIHDLHRRPRPRARKDRHWPASSILVADTIVPWLVHVPACWKLAVDQG